MNEYVLHYLWKFQKFHNSNLVLSNGQSLVIFNQGHHNHDSGPDFEEARVKIDDIEWAGHIEIHIRSSDWIRHKHHLDASYENVILHVVWDHDQDILIQGAPLPTLELRSIVEPELVTRIQQYFDSSNQILCGEQLHSVSDLHFDSMIDRALIERLEKKAKTIQESLIRLDNDWESITYYSLASNFGFSTNKLQFIKLTERLPYNILKKNLQNSHSTEALILGQSGFLEESIDDYQAMLKAEYDYLRSKYKLPDPLKKSEWKFSRMRPANFPIVRLVQFASLLNNHPKLFSKLIEVKNPKDITRSIAFEVPEYWQNYYDFGKKRTKPSRSVGKTTLDNLLINSVVPLLAAYSKYSGEQDYMDRAVLLLEYIPAESNRITKTWGKWKIPKSAFESQGIIQLTNEYCSQRKCLQCTVGISLLHQ